MAGRCTFQWKYSYSLSPSVRFKRLVITTVCGTRGLKLVTFSDMEMTVTHRKQYAYKSLKTRFL